MLAVGSTPCRRVGSNTAVGSDGAVAAPVGDDAAIAQPRVGVDLGSFGVPDLEVQVRSGGPALVADGGDLLAGVDTLTRRDLVGAHVTVDGGGAVVVEDADPLAEAGSRSGVEDRAVGRGL